MNESIWLRRYAIIMALLAALGTLTACSDDDDDDDDVTTTNDDDDTTDDDDDVTSDDDDDDTTGEEGPFDDLPSSVKQDEVPFPVTETTYVVYDSYGIPHVYAASEQDMVRGLAFAHARDRLLQMDLFRRNAQGTLTEVAGEVALDVDYEQRQTGLKWAAEDSYALMAQEEKDILQAYSEGVNAVIDMLRDDEFGASQLGIFLPVVYASLGLTPADVAHWRPIDTVSFGKLMAFQLSDDSGSEMGRTRDVNAWREAFAGTPLEGIHSDMRSPIPMEPTTMIDGFPNGSTSARTAKGFAGNWRPINYGTRTPLMPFSLLDRAIKVLENPLFPKSPIRDFTDSGSNNWIVAGKNSATGQPILANDPHLGLDYPPTFYEAHINTRLLNPEGDFNVIGINFAGTPGIVIGHNENLAWGVTTFGPDVSDVWEEQYTPGSPPTVLWHGGQSPVEVRNEEFNLRNSNGTMTTVTRPIEIVPHHGVILSKDEEKGMALSWRWSGHTVHSSELRAFWEINQAATQAEFEEAQDHFLVGAQSFVSIFDNGDIFYTGDAYIPLRQAGALELDTPPWLVLPGDGCCDWLDDRVPESKVPHALNPDKGYIVTANNDAVGVTLDGNPLNDEFYLGAFFANGLRAFRIDELINEHLDGGQKHTMETLADIQNDHRSGWGARMNSFILDAIAANPGGLADDSLVQAALPYLQGWSYDTPSGFVMDNPGEPDSNRIEWSETTDPDVRRDSVASSIFTAWLGDMISNTLDDEREEAFQKTGVRPGTDGAKTIDLLLRRTGQAVVPTDLYFDNIATPEVETRDEQILLSLIEAMTKLQATGKFREDGQPEPDMDQWLWGKIHRLTFDHLTVALDDAAAFLSIPPNGEPGFPRPGTSDSVDPAGHGMGCCNNNYGSGPNMRMVVTFEGAGKPKGYNVLPGGNSDTLNDPHRGDQASLWVNNETHPMWFELDDVKANAERIFVLTPQ